LAAALAGQAAGLAGLARSAPVDPAAPAGEVTAMGLLGLFGDDDRPPAPPIVAPAPPPPAPLPTPVDPPLDPYAPEPAVVLGTIEIPRMGLAVPLNQGISLNSIDRGPSHWPGTALPGDPGNVVIAGHRVTAGGPFRDIDQLQPGDAVVFTVGSERSTYRVTGHEVVTPDAMRIVEQTPEPTATLFACHPPGSAKYRYVVRLALAEVVDLAPASTPRSFTF
jgi:sortase A